MSKRKVKGFVIEGVTEDGSEYVCAWGAYDKVEAREGFQRKFPLWIIEKIVEVEDDE